MWCSYEMPLYEKYFLDWYTDRCKYKSRRCYECIRLYKEKRRKEIRQLRRRIEQKYRENKEISIEKAGLVEASKGV